MPVEASVHAECEENVFWPILYTAEPTVATSMKKAGDATNKEDADEALDSLLLMNEAWYATSPSTSRVLPFLRLTLAGMRVTSAHRKTGQTLCARWRHASSPSHILLLSSGATSSP